MTFGSGIAVAGVAYAVQAVVGHVMPLFVGKEVARNNRWLMEKHQEAQQQSTPAQPDKPVPASGTYL